MLNVKYQLLTFGCYCDILNMSLFIHGLQIDNSKVIRICRAGHTFPQLLPMSLVPNIVLCTRLEIGGVHVVDVPDFVSISSAGIILPTILPYPRLRLFFEETNQ
jgi:hypothetical protein